MKSLPQNLFKAAYITVGFPRLTPESMQMSKVVNSTFRSMRRCHKGLTSCTLACEWNVTGSSYKCKPAGCACPRSRLINGRARMGIESYRWCVCSAYSTWSHLDFFWFYLCILSVRIPQCFNRIREVTQKQTSVCKLYIYICFAFFIH